MTKPTSRDVISHGAIWRREREWLVLCLVCFGSLALRLYVLQFHPFVHWDGTYYINYFRDSSWRSVFHPGYPIFIELFRLVIPNGVKAAQMVSVVFGALLPIPLFYLSRRFLSSMLGFLVTIIVVLNPLLIRFSAVTMSESQFLFLEISSFVFFLDRRPLLFGITSGLAYLTRPEALAFFAILIVYDIMKYRQWRFIGILMGSFLLFVLPYLIYLRVETKEWMLTPKTVNFRVWDKDWSVNVAREASNAPTFSLSERLETAFDLYPNRLIAYTNLLLFFGGFPLIILGLIGMIRVRNILIAGMPMLFILPLFGINPGERFIIPYIPFFAIFAMLLIAKVRKSLLRILAAFMIIAGYSTTALYAITPEEGTTEFCTAGLAMRPLTKKDDIFVDRKPYTAYYAGGKFVEMPNDPVDSILAFARTIGAKYLVVSARVVRVFRPQLNFLLYSDTTINRLHLKTVYVNGLDSGYGIRVIQISQ